MGIKRIHVILGVILAVIVVMFFLNRSKKKAVPVEKPKIEQKRETAEPKPRSMSREKLARQAVAVAGEYWKIAKREKRDVAKEQDRPGNRDDEDIDEQLLLRVLLALDDGQVY